jgi:hypothetical protein
VAEMDGNLRHLEHSVEVGVSATFARNFLTDISNWDDPPARFTLEGPFAAGTQGATELPGQEPLRWRLLEVQEGERYTTEMRLDRAVLRFEWRFEALSERRTRLTQQIMLNGENAAAYIGQVEAGFGSNLAAGMQRIAAAMEKRQQESGRFETQN